MKEIDKKLKAMLIKQVYINEPLSDKLIKDLPNPRYSSGKLMKFGDIPLHIIEVVADSSEVEITVDTVNIAHYKFLVKEPQKTGIKTILLEQSEIDHYCKNYMYAGGSEVAIHAIKRQE